jgi:hypothetical protein
MNAADRVVCADCGRRRTPHSRIEEGALCSNCAAKRRPLEPCGRCGHIRRVIVRDPSGSAVCNSCYLRGRKTPCSNCGQLRAIASRSPAGPLCRRCGPPRARTSCASCGRVAEQSVHDASGRPICKRCWAAQKKMCVRCGTVERVAVRTLQGAICEHCLLALLTHPVPCGDCGIVRPNVADDHRPLCPECAGLRFKFECPRCRRFARPTIKPGVCVACHETQLRERSTLRFATADATLDGYHSQVAQLIDSTPEPWKLPIKRYARWALTGPLQRRVDAGVEITTSVLRWPLRRLKIAQRFAAAAAAAALGPSDIRQTHLDSWLIEFPTQRAELRSLVNWCTAHRYMRSDLSVDAATTRETRRSLSEHDRLDLVQRLLRKEHDPAARLAALLVVVFGQPLTRTTRLRTDAVQISANGVVIRIGTTAIRLREPLGQLAETVAVAAHDLGSPWLFPSSQGGRPISPERLAERLRAAGLHSPLLARNTARAVLAEQMPASLVAEIVGISNAAAERWAKAVGTARVTYTGLRL